MKSKELITLLLTLEIVSCTYFAQDGYNKKLLNSFKASRSLAYSASKTRIINGYPAIEGQFPWHVIIKRYQVDDLWCGGSIISENLILTAAHCVHGLQLPSVYIAYGTVNLNETMNLIESKALIEHPKFDPNTLHNDIALIKLSSSIQFNEKVNKIKLVSKSDARKLFVGQMTNVMGFGYTSDTSGDFSQILLYADMVVVENAYCSKSFPGFVIDSTMCAKGEQNANICGGDSGGAMVMQKNGEYIQIGINSFVSRSGCEEPFPAGFTRVSSFLDFISKHLGN